MVRMVVTLLEHCSRVSDSVTRSEDISQHQSMMSVNLYADKFRHHEREHSSHEPVFSGSSSSSASRSRSGRSGWDVIKKAIFTPIGTKETSINRRRRSRRNLLEKERPERPDAVDYHGAETREEENYNSITTINEAESCERNGLKHFH